MAYTNIDDPSAHFQTTLYTGNSTVNHSITNDGNSSMKPDLWWQINRDLARGTYVADSSRGVTKYIYTFLTLAEGTVSNYVTSFNSNGFTLGSGDTAVNNNAQRFVTWNWKANGGTTSSNTAGNITSTVQANTDAGFSIVTWTGNENSSATVGHGLGVKPDMVFFKRRNAAYNWVVYCGQLGIVGGNNMFAYLNLTNSAEQGAGFNFTSTTITPTNGAPTNSGDMIAYCFAGKQGYSKFGKYTGNGNTNGTYVYTGFKPAFVMTKPSSAVGSWSFYDHKRTGYNTIDVWLRANGGDAESTSAIPGEDIDILSNGFKFRNGDNTINAAYSTYIYMAFAENPFVTSTGVPACAR